MIVGNVHITQHVFIKRVHMEIDSFPDPTPLAREWGQLRADSATCENLRKFFVVSIVLQNRLQDRIYIFDHMNNFEIDYELDCRLQNRSQTRLSLAKLTSVN